MLFNRPVAAMLLSWSVIFAIMVSLGTPSVGQNNNAQWISKRFNVRSRASQTTATQKLPHFTTAPTFQSPLGAKPLQGDVTTYHEITGGLSLQ